MILVAGLQAGELEPLSDPLGELVEIERAVEHDARAPVAVPADLALDRAQALDDDDDLLADAIFLDRLNLDAAKRDVVDVDGIIGLANPHRRLARNLEARWTRTEAVTRLATGEKLTKIDVLVELDSCHPIADPNHGRRDLLRRELNADTFAHLGSARDDRHHS